MAKHVRKIYEILNDKGVCVLHTIGSILPPQPNAPFIQKWIFPKMPKNHPGVLEKYRGTFLNKPEKSREKCSKTALECRGEAFR